MTFKQWLYWNIKLPIRVFVNRHIKHMDEEILELSIMADASSKGLTERLNLEGYTKFVNIEKTVRLTKSEEIDIMTSSFGTSCTCCSCDRVFKCEYSFDAYNTDGD